MELQEHIFKEKSREEKVIFVNGRYIKQIERNITGSSKYCVVGGINTYSISHEYDEKLEFSHKDNMLLKEYCTDLSNKVKGLSKNIFFFQINITTLNRNISIKPPAGEVVNSGKYHGRFFFEIGFKSNANIFVTVYDKGYSQLDEPLGEKWWEDVKEDSILNKFSDLDRHLYRQNIEDGSYNVVLSPYVAGLLAHEVFGHIFEEDNRYYNEHIVNQLSNEQYNQELTIIDDPKVPRGWGSLRVDDSGHEQRKISIVENGELSEQIKRGERINRLIRQDYKHNLLSRVSNTLILPGSKSVQELLWESDNGIYIENAGKCYCDPVTGEIIMPVYEAFKIRGNKKVSCLNNFSLYANANTILKSIHTIGSDFELNGVICGKMGQKIPVGIGAPSLLLKDIDLYM